MQSILRKLLEGLHPGYNYIYASASKDQVVRYHTKLILPCCTTLQQRNWNEMPPHLFQITKGVIQVWTLNGSFQLVPILLIGHYKGATLVVSRSALIITSSTLGYEVTTFEFPSQKQERKRGWEPSFALDLKLNFGVLIRPYWHGQVHILIKDNQIDFIYKN